MTALFRMSAPLRVLFTALLAGFLVSGCLFGANSGEPFELTIAHINDSHSNIRPPDTQSITLDGQTYYAEQGGFARLVTLFNALSAPNTLKIHAGDAITGTYFYTLFEGETDAIALNSVCFDAFVPGNHEFDFSDSGLKTFLDFLRNKGPACTTPVLAANIRPAAGTPLAQRPDGTPYFEPYLIRSVGGVRVGILGIDVKGKTQNASKPLATTVFEDEVESAQRTIDLLKAQGVRHIVLISHVGYDSDLALAARLTDVDVIIGGDSHTFLGTSSTVLGKTSAGDYPTLARNRSGELVCIGQAWEYTKVFARMTVKFNDDGTVKSCGGVAAVVIGDQLYTDRNRTVPVGAALNASLLARLAAYPEVVVAAEDQAFKTRLAPYEARYDAETRTVVGTLRSDQSLCLVRVPGTRNRGGAICSGVENKATGSDIAQIVAEGYRAASARASLPFAADVGLTNAGGVRVALETDGINNLTLTVEDAFKVQPFPNELIVVQITGAQLRTALEQGVANWLDDGNSDGSHPYASGLRWDLNLTRPRGSRFSNLEVKDAMLGWTPLDPAKTYRLIITDYLRDGFEGYAVFRDLCKTAGSTACEPLGGIYAADSLVNYLRAVGVVTRPACADYSHQNAVDATGRLLTRCQ